MEQPKRLSTFPGLLASFTPSKTSPQFCCILLPPSAPPPFLSPPPTLKHAPHVLIPPHAKEEKNHEETNQAFSPRSRFIFSLLPQLPAGRQARHHHLSLSLLAALVEVWASSPRSGDQEVAAVAGAGAHVAFGDLVAFSVR